MDSFNGNKELDPSEFVIGLAEFGISMSKADALKLLKYMDSDGSGTINFDEFLFAIKGGISKKRLPVVQAAFKKMDKDGSG